MGIRHETSGLNAKPHTSDCQLTKIGVAKCGLSCYNVEEKFFRAGFTVRKR